jgi:hypothetical protein
VRTWLGASMSGARSWRAHRPAMAAGQNTGRQEVVQMADAASMQRARPAVVLSSFGAGPDRTQRGQAHQVGARVAGVIARQDF